jgi:hypothetical protein
MPKIENEFAADSAGIVEIKELICSFWQSAKNSACLLGMSFFSVMP